MSESLNVPQQHASLMKTWFCRSELLCKALFYPCHYGSRMKGTLCFFSIIPALCCILLLSAGCEPGADSTVSSALFDREPGVLSRFTVPADSISVKARYQDEIGNGGYLFAGTHDTVESFALFSFKRPGQSVIDSLHSATVTLTVKDTWSSGSLAIALYKASSDWDESGRLDASSAAYTLGEPIGVVSRTDSGFTSLEFSIPGDYIDTWVGNGSFLIQTAPGGEGMILVSSDNSTSSPSLQLVARNASASYDTTTILSNKGTFRIINDIPDDAPVVADGDAAGYVIRLAIPEFGVPPSPINKCNLMFTLQDRLITETSMSLILYRLTTEFSTIDDVEVDASDAIELSITPDSTIYSVDISSYINSWRNDRTTNHGILVKPSSTGSSLDYAVLTPGDSLVIIYSSLPEAP
jgi:hypothetical protein